MTERARAIEDGYGEALPAGAGEPDLFGASTGAEFSPCRTWRYRLWRVWNDQRPLLMFLMLNPSTADEQSNDATVERCQRRSLAWSYGGLVVCNIFAFRATDPGEMKKAPDPVGPVNDRAILAEAKRADTVLCAWGTHGAFRDRDLAVTRMLRDAGIELYCLEHTQGGHPRHPLYIPYRREPVLFHERGASQAS